MRTVRDDSENVARWVAERLPHVRDFGFGPCKAIGVVKSDGSPMAGVVFHDWQPHHMTIQISLASVSPRWATQNILRDILSYPFMEIGLFKAWSVTEIANERALRFALGIGFRREGVLRHQFGKKKHAVFISMTAPEFGERYGQAVRARAA